MRLFLKYPCLMLIGGLGYMILELLFRGRTHWTMGVTGGLCFVALYLIEIYSGEVLWRKCVMGALVITTIEFLVGIVVNLVLGWKVWDYSAMPFNLLGQICPIFTVLWLGVSAGAMKLIRHFITAHSKLKNKRGNLKVSGSTPDTSA